MFSVRSDRLIPWIYVEPPPADEVPGFRLNTDVGSGRDTRSTPVGSFEFGAPPGTRIAGYPEATQALAQPALGASTPSPDFLPPSTPPAGFAQFRIGRPDDVRGFNFRLLEDVVPDFNLVESRSGIQRQQTPWSDGTPTALQELPDTAPTPSGVGHPPQLAPPQLPGWLYKVVTMPVPQLSTAFDPQTGRRIVPYEPLIGPVRSSLVTNENVGGTDDVPYADDSGLPPELDLSQLASAEPRPPLTPIGNAWPQPSMDRWLHGQADGAEPKIPLVSPVLPQPADAAPAPAAGSVAASNLILASAGDAEELRAMQGTPLPQNQTDRKGPVTPRELHSRPSEQRTEEPPPQAIEDSRGAIAAQIEELASSIATFGSRIYEDSILKARDDLARLAERLRNDPGETVLSILNSFPQTRVEGKLVGGLAAVVTILANAKRGLEFEKAVLHALNAESLTTKIAKNTSKIAIEELGRSVPDVLQRGIREIKSGIEINNSIQLRVQAAYAKLFKVPLSLVVGPNTQRISKSVRDAVRETGGTIQRFDPATGVFTAVQ